MPFRQECTFTWAVVALIGCSLDNAIAAGFAEAKTFHSVAPTPNTGDLLKLLGHGAFFTESTLQRGGTVRAT